MKVHSWEEGDRPTLWTRARQQAPQAKAAIVEMLASQDWAHIAYVVLDWTGRIAFIDGDGRSRDASVPVLDNAPPVMYIQVIKAMPQRGGTCLAEYRLDVDDMFGGTVITGVDLQGLLADLRSALDEKVEQVRQGGQN